METIVSIKKTFYLDFLKQIKPLGQPLPLHPHRHAVAMLLEQGMLFGFAQVVGHHFLHHFVQGDLGPPAKVFFGFAGVAEQGFYLGGAEIAGVYAHHHLA